MQSKEQWLEQAELATKYAFARPASDMRGFFDALRDAEDFKRLAAECERVAA